MTTSLTTRVSRILTDPAREWPVIATESETVATLYRNYILILAAIGPLALLLRYPSAPAFVAAGLQYGVQLAAVFICTLVIERLAPKFRSTGHTVQVMQLVAYANTPSWIAGFANILGIPGNFVLLVAGVYAIYLYYLGLPVLLKTPPDQIVPFMLVSAIVIIAVAMVLSILVATVIGGSLFAVL
jgi:hypothetical protein